MSNWLTVKAERNKKSFARLSRGHYVGMRAQALVKVLFEVGTRGDVVDALSINQGNSERVVAQYCRRQARIT